MRQRIRAIRAASNSPPVQIGIRMTRTAAGGAAQPQGMLLTRTITGPHESDVDGNGSGAINGTEPGLSGDYQFQIDGIIGGDILEWSGEDAALGDNPITVTLLAAYGNVATFNLYVPIGLGVALIYCTVNGVQFMTNAAISEVG